MNTICQDRDIKAGSFEYAGIDPLGHALALTRRALDQARICQHLCDRAHIGTRQQVGKNTPGSWQTFANWIQLADPCQLDFVLNQQVTSKLARWQEGRAANLPTELTRCFYSLSTPVPVVGDSPLPTGEVNTPTMSRGCSPLCCPHAYCPRSDVGGVQ